MSAATETATLTSRRVTSYDVARASGVAQSTVSRCYRADGGISAPTRQKVLLVAERLGYVPNALARSLITRRSNLVAVVMTRDTQRTNPDVLHAIGAALAAAGKQLLLLAVDAEWIALADLRAVLEYPLDGMISCVLLPDDDLRELGRRRLPIVFYNRQPEGVPADSVTTNHFSAAADVASALHKAGHRRFLCMSGPGRAPVSRLRVAGFTERLKLLGMEPTPILRADYSYDSGRAVFFEHIGKMERPTAVFCANDQIAMGVMDACRTDLGWKIPADISVIGFDDVAEAARPTYELTTVHQDSVGMAKEAVRLLLQRLDHPGEAPVHAMFDAKLRIRHSAIRLKDFER